MKNKWEHDEMVLTLYIYLTHNPEELHKYSSFMIDFCNRLNIYTGKSFTPSSIEMRISNYKSVDPNYHKVGLANGGKSVKEFWDTYNKKMDYMSELYEKFVNSTYKAITEESVKELKEIEKEYSSSNIDDKDGYIESVISIRNGAIQKVFRDNLIIEFNQKCAICGINNRGLLISSHILPYSKCKRKEDMINHNNGLLLCPNHDALFDKKLISFEENGNIIISSNVDKQLFKDLNITESIKIKKCFLNKERIAFLKLHREMMK